MTAAGFYLPLILCENVYLFANFIFSMYNDISLSTYRIQNESFRRFMGSIFEFIANIVEAAIVAQFLMRYFGLKNKKYPLVKFCIITMIYATVVTISNIWTYFSVHEEYIIDITMLTIMVVFLKGRMLEKILLIFMNSIILSTTGILLTGVFGNFIVYDANGYPEFGVLRVALVVLAKVTYIICTELIIRNKIEDSQYVSNTVYLKLNAAMIITAVAELFLMDIVYMSAKSSSIVSVYFVIVALVAVDTILYTLFVNLTNTSINLIKEEVKNAAYESEKKIIENMHEINKQTMIVRHDMKSKLTYIMFKLDEGDIKGAEKFLSEELDIELSDVNIISTGNRIADAILNMHAETARKQGIPFRMNITGNLGMVNEVDITIILSNLLDYALELAGTSDVPYAGVDVKDTDNGIMIRAYSSYGELKLNNGMLNVRNIADRYNGTFEFEHRDGRCTVVVCLKNGETDNVIQNRKACTIAD